MPKPVIDITDMPDGDTSRTHFYSKTQLTTGREEVHDSTTRNALATRRNAFSEELTALYADSYTRWLEGTSTKTRERVQARVRAVKHGMSVTAPIFCLGPSGCPFFAACPIPEKPGVPGPIGDYPVGLQCVLEVEYVAQQVVDYIHKLDVDPADPVEMSLINELALLDLLRNRAVLVLASGDRRGHGRDLLTIDESIVGWSEDGTPLTSQSTKAHPAVDIMERHEKRRSRILEQFAATREKRMRLYGGDLTPGTSLEAHMQLIREFMTKIATSGIALGGPEGISGLLDHTAEEEIA